MAASSASSSGPGALGPGPAGPSSPTPPPTAPPIRGFATGLVIAASTMLFVGLLGAFMVLRGSSTRGEDAIALPPLTGWATALIIGSSLALAIATRAHRQGQLRRARIGFDVTLAAALLFLVLQGLAAHRWVQAGSLPSTDNWRAGVYLLAGLHALHAIAGLLWLARVRLQGLEAASLLRAGVFWHFVGILWIALFLFLRGSPF